MIDHSNRGCQFSLNTCTEMLNYLRGTSTGGGKVSRYDAFIDLLKHRVEEDTQMWVGGREIIVNEGCALTPVLTLSKEWGWDRKTVRRFLSQLEVFGFIHLESIDGITVTRFPGIADIPDDSTNI